MLFLLLLINSWHLYRLAYNFFYYSIVDCYRTILGHRISMAHTFRFSAKNFSSVDACLALHCKHLLIYRETIVTIYIAARTSWNSPTENPSLYLRVTGKPVRLKNVLKNQNRNAFIALGTLVFRLARDIVFLKMWIMRRAAFIYAYKAPPHTVHWNNAFLASSTTGVLHFVHDLRCRQSSWFMLQHAC